MVLKPQDVLVVLKLVASGGLNFTFAQLGQQIGMSASESHQAFHRARRAGLVQPVFNQPVNGAVAELLIHGLKYVFPVHPGGRTRGMLTGVAAPPLSASFNVGTADRDVFVWPDPEGSHAGLEIRPLCRSVPVAARQDARLYEWLVVADVLRGAGRARERELAEEWVRGRLQNNASR